MNEYRNYLASYFVEIELRVLIFTVKPQISKQKELTFKAPDIDYI